MEPPLAAVQIGDVLASKYRVERILGQGGMGMVVAARHEQLGFLVALKFMLPGSSTGGRVLSERFLREARAAGSLHSEHVARVTDFGTLESGAPYIVMEFLQGSDLQGVLDSVGVLPVHEATEYVRQACKGMAEAHAQGIVHRDLKPQNLFLTKRPDGTPLVKVLDFGISKLTGPDPSLSVTASSEMMGSPLYMAPEQVRSSKNVDSRADIYSLGAILYQLLTGRVPVQAETLGELFERLFTQPMEPPRTHRPDLPAELDALVMRCLTKNPEDRLPAVTDLEAALAPFTDARRSLTGLSAAPMSAAAPAAVAAVAAPVAVPAVSQPSAIGSTTNAPAVSEREVPRPRNRTPMLVGAGAAIALLVVGGGVSLLLRSQAAPPAAATAVATPTPSAADTAPIASAMLAHSDTPAAAPSAAPSASAEAAPSASVAATATATSRPASATTEHPGKRPALPPAASPHKPASPNKPPSNADPFSSPD